MNLYLYEKHILEHHRELQREAERERMLAGLRQSMLRYAASKLGGLLVTLGTRLERVEQYREPVVC